MTDSSFRLQVGQMAQRIKVAAIAVVPPVKLQHIERIAIHAPARHIDFSLDDLLRRDVKGLYKKALAGEIDHFTGVSDPYEAPLRPEVRVDSETQSVEQSLAAILDDLKQRQLIPEPADA